MEKSRAEERPWFKNKKRIKNSVKKRNKFLCESDWYWRSSTLASRFQTKKSPSNQNLPYIVLKARFSFLYASLCTKTLTIARSPSVASNLEAVCGFVVLLLSTFYDFSIFADGFSFASGNFAHYCDVLLIAPLTVSAMGYFSREILIHGHWCQEVPLSHWLAVSRGEIISWRGASCLICEPLSAKISHLILGGIQPLWPIL